MQTSEYLVLILFLCMGCVALLASIFHFKWFFESQQALPFVKWFGLLGCRMFYGLLGITMIGCAIAGFLTWK